MNVVIDAHWDDEANVWVAVARDEIGLATEAPTVEELERRIALVLPDLLEGENDQHVEFELLAEPTRSPPDLPKSF